MRRCSASLSWALPFLLLPLLLIGCRAEHQKEGGKATTKRYQTAVSLSPGSSEIIRTKAMGTTLVGRTEYCNYPTMDTKIPVVMKGTKPNYEKIAEIKPAIIVYDDQLFSEADIAKFGELGIETFPISGNTVEDFIVCLYDLGRTLHVEQTISDYVEEIRGAVGAAKGAPPAPLKVAVMMPGKGSEHMIAGTKSFVADVVRQSGGTPVGPETDQFVPASAESLVALNPDAIVTSDDPAPILNDPRLKSVAAVAKRQMAKVDPDVLLRRGSRVDKLIRSIYGFFVGMSPATT